MLPATTVAATEYVSSRRSRWRDGLRGLALPIASILAGFGLWEIVGRFVVTDPLYFVPFSAVVRAEWDLITSGRLGHDVATSATEFAYGFAVAAAVGIGFGLLLGVSAKLRAIFDPWISALNATPLVALMPLYLIVFGIGTMSKAALVATIAIFPILINTSVGVMTTDRAFREVASAYRATRHQFFAKIYLPAALPHIVSGLRLGVAHGLIGVVVGEFFFPNAGVGALIARAGQSFATAELFAALLILTITSLVLNEALKRAEKRLAPWRHT